MGEKYRCAYCRELIVADNDKHICIEQLKIIISPEKFRSLATWIDFVDSMMPIVDGTEVQDDLRKFADAMDKIYEQRISKINNQCIKTG